MLTVAFRPTLAAEQTLDSLKETYETEVQKIGDAHEVKLKGLLDAYGRSLDKAIELLREEGDPDPVLVASAERIRFQQERTVPKPTADDLPKMLQDIQSKYHDTVKAAEVEKGRSFVGLTEKYVTALDRLMRQRTNENKLDLALNVKAEKERVELVLADVDSKLEAVEERVRQQMEAAKRSKEQEEKMAALVARRSRLPEGAKDAVEWNGHFYLVVTARLGWHKARERCEQMGGHLVFLETKEEWDFINRLRDGRDVWIGATDEKKEGDWRWTDGRKVGKWIPGNGPTPIPQVHGRDDYLHMWNGKKSGNWDDVTSGWAAAHICEWEF